MASGVSVAFYAASVSFHGLAGDHPAVAPPTTALGSSAALCLVSYFISAIEAGEPHEELGLFQFAPTAWLKVNGDGAVAFHPKNCLKLSGSAHAVDGEGACPFYRACLGSQDERRLRQ